jgi:leucyl aminopeptidase
MKVTFKDSRSSLTRTDLLVVLGFQKQPVGLPSGVRIAPLVKKGFRGEFRESRLTDALGGPAGRVLLIGLGEEGDPEKVRRAAAIAVKKAEGIRAPRVTFWVAPKLERALGGAEAVGSALAEGAVMGSYSCTRFKSKAKKPHLTHLTLCGSAPLRRGGRRGVALGAANLFTRDLQNAPGNLMRPRDLVTAARKLARRSPRISCTALSEAQMAKLGMGSLLSVSRGSSEPAHLVHLKYRPRGRARGRIAFVGKGLTFDAGGISLKPSAKMHEMKYDMSGGAAVLGLFHALGDLDVPFEVHGLVPASENLPDGKANKPGDIVKAMNGMTIEVLNTDAEGRLILADALTYTVKKVKPDTIVDLATLTGAVVVALGHELSGVMGNDEKLLDALVGAGKTSGELVWPLPLLEVHKKQMKSKVADLRNINAGQGAGSPTAAAFLSNFVGEIPWAHLDIAGTAWGAEDRDYQGGPLGTGIGVRLLMQYLADRA